MSILYIDVTQEQVTTSDVAIYPTPSVSNFESAHIIYANCTNESATDTELTVNIVKSGEAVAVTNRYFPPKVIFAGRTDPLSPLVGAVLKAGDFINTIAGSANNLNLKLTIKEIYSDT